MNYTLKSDITWWKQKQLKAHSLRRCSVLTLSSWQHHSPSSSAMLFWLRQGLHVQRKQQSAMSSPASSLSFLFLQKMIPDLLSPFWKFLAKYYCSLKFTFNNSHPFALPASSTSGWSGELLIPSEERAQQPHCFPRHGQFETVLQAI